MQALLYCVAQLAGAVTAAYALVAVLPDTNWRFDALRMITPETISDFSRWNAMLLEGVLTFIVVFVYFASVVDAKGETRGGSQSVAGFGVGLAVAIETLVAAPFTGAALNPARSFGPALATHHWQNHGVYWVGPLFGGALAGILYDAIFLHNRLNS
jgi:glycerol uptake facilitator-like aquaporin